jgi:CubicO group peptidase (beta-lactamase class C family)
MNVGSGPEPLGTSLREPIRGLGRDYASSMPISPEDVGSSGLGLERARTYVSDCVERGEIAGAVMVVSRQDQVAQLACVGRRDIEADAPMEPDTIFRIASMTKPITSVGALMLVEAGKLRLDDPVSRYIPEFADVEVFDRVEDGRVVLAPLKRPITVHHLLTHTSGIDSDAPDPALDAEFDNLGDGRYGSPEFMRRLAAHPLAHQPGEGWRYGWSFAVLGRVIEVVSDRPFDEYLASMIFAPLGMIDSGFYVPPEKSGRLAAVYETEDRVLRQVDDEDTREVTERHPLVHGSSGVASTALDFHRFTRMLQRRGELDGVRLLRPESVELMTRNHLSTALSPIRIFDYLSEGEGYGLGVGVSIEPPAPRMPGSVGTHGWAGSWGTRFWIDPVREMSGVFMAQSMPFTFVGIGEGFWTLACQAVAD